MRVDCSEKERADQDSSNFPEITSHHAVHEESKNEFLGYGRQRHSQDYDQDSLFERAGLTEHFDDRLLVRHPLEHPLANNVGQKNQRIGSENQYRAGDGRAEKSNFGKTA